MATELHLVSSVEQAFSLANSLGAKGIAIDTEGVLIPYVGNSPSWAAALDACTSPEASISLRVLDGQLLDNPNMKHGLITNNTNSLIADAPSSTGRGEGIVDIVARRAGGLAVVHKNMEYQGRTLLPKPDEDQGLVLAEILEVDPSEMILIDDQGKNTGTAVRAGYKAMIVPPAIGSKNRRGRTREHRGVMWTRRIEQAAFRSLETRGTLARVAFKKAAGIDIEQISHFERHSLPQAA